MPSPPTLLPVYRVARATAHDDLTLLVACTDAAAAYAGDNPTHFLALLNELILGAGNPLVALFVAPLSRAHQVLHKKVRAVPRSRIVNRFGSTGFAADDGGNQVQHFWFSVLVAYHYGTTLAVLLAWYHEWNPPPALNWLPLSGHGYGTPADLHLSHQGIALGQLLARRRIAPAAVGAWLARELAPPPAAPA